MPLSFIHTAVIPEHLAIAFSQIIQKIAFVEIPRPPIELSIATLHIILIISNIFLPLCVRPSPLTIPLTNFEIPMESAFSLIPFVFTLTIWATVQVVADVLITIFEDLSPMSMLQTVIEVAFIPRIVGLKHPIAVDDAHTPFAIIQ